MQDYSQSAIEAASHAEVAYCKFITPNDAGITGGHQYGYHLHRDAWKLMFSESGVKGANKDKEVTIRWQDDFETASRFIYYGEKTRNEYRLTRVAKGVPFNGDGSVGNLLVLCKQAENYYRAYVLETEDEIDNFLNFFGIPPTDANGLISKLAAAPGPGDMQTLMQQYVQGLPDGFPTGEEVAVAARDIYARVSGMTDSQMVTDPDTVVMNWVNTEYSLFKEIEKARYGEKYLNAPFASVDSLVEAANTILNRRKSRAGKSLENHLGRIFEANGLPFSEQKATEGHKKPDFIMPGIEQYHDAGYDAEKLVFLASKTTCKDRWRQVLNEAGRTPQKHLFTLQQGISTNQLDEMKDESLTLVVPEAHLGTFPASNRDDIMTLKQFIAHAKQTVL